jgi:signal transduction histidine kinase
MPHLDTAPAGRDSDVMIPARRRLAETLTNERRYGLLGLGLSVVVLGSLVVAAAHDHEPLVLLLTPPALAAILLRRSHTRLALLLAVAVVAADPGDRALVLPVMAVLYTLATRSPWMIAAGAGAGAAIVATIADCVWGGGTALDQGGIIGNAIGWAASCAAAVAFGLYIGAQSRIRDALRERAERLDRERGLLTDRAVAEERVRIAQELHDIVAHNVSLMVVQAQALGATVPDERVVHAADAIADLGRQAMTEMHTTLRLLRDDARTPELSPQPGLGQLDHLVEQLRRAGLTIELSVQGQPRQLGPGVDLSAYRIIQEALTNVVKHADHASTTVTLVYRPEGIEMTITDTEHQARTTVLQPAPAGHGVIGMRERAALFGGQLITESLPDGFEVRATLPYEPTPS